ncbi:cytochrome c oxidase subunit I [Parapusillimonas granuli]|uniref:cytochrome-c oxidase n=1 Tax=Parapusillimonas granuli TaxID=380911 RepID=A0A853FSZ8_9BURK|nr:cytochrome c oxidase subunit I+III [Parapusillimonas granuli]MEB2400393.1 cytochrome c oxidase subunit I [Alcaligenaceae bacterium]NYT47798.1 cytochrome c oxidase subunit I [Parapusillimonas granuli]
MNDERPHPIALHHALERQWASPKGWRSLSAVNHGTMGMRFIIAALCFFLVGGVLAMLMRAQLATSGSAFLDSDLYAQIFTMHGTVMMFLFAIPMLEGFAFYLLPKMLGSRDLAYPRLGAYAWWCYLFGGLILIVAMLLGVAPDKGWFMYTPLSGKQFTPGINSDIWLIGITFAEISALCGAVELIATILKIRAPGMSLRQLPIFAWYMLVTAGMILVGFPPLILGSILLELERAFGLPFFSVALGGDNLLWQHLFWMFGHPEVYIIFLPAAGLVSTMIPTFARHPLLGYSWVVNSVVAMGFLSFGLWVHHMFSVGIPQLSLAFFSVASMLVAIPTAIQFFAWIATLWAGQVALRLPVLYLGGFLFIFVIGGLTGVMVALVPFNVQVHDTHFVVAHLHYVLTGGMVFPLLAASYYWLPHFTGRMPSGSLGTAGFWLIFGGFNITFLPMHLTGLLGMPRRIDAYAADMGWDLLNLTSSMGGFIQAIGFAVFLLDVGLHARRGTPAPRNPWTAGTLEWAMPTPPASYNFATQPDVEHRYPLWRNSALGAELAGGRHWLGGYPPAHRQTMSVDALTGNPQSVVNLPGSSWLPLYCGLATGVFFLGLLFKAYAVALLFAGVVALLFMVWVWMESPRGSQEAIEAKPGVWLPVHTDCRSSPGWWGMACTLLANGTFLASLVFGIVFLRLYAPNWPPGQWLGVPPLQAAWIFLAYGGMALCVWRGNRPRAGGGWLYGCAGSTVLALVPVAAIIGRLEDPASHAYWACMMVALAYMAVHLALVLVMAAFIALRRIRHGGAAPFSEETRIFGMWTLHSAAGGAALMVLILSLRGGA